MRLTALGLMAPLALAAALTLGPSAIPALAEDELPPTSQFFDEYDTNADGKVMADEFAGSSEIFKLLDKNGDGAITPDELGLPADYKPDPRAKQKPAGREGPARGGKGGEMAKRLEQFRKRLEKMDTNKDGRVSKEEWQGPEQAFARVDRNKDGFIDAKDRMQGEARRKGDGGKAGKGDRAGKAGKGGEQAAARMKERAQGHFKSLDKNGDGKLTADEAPDPRMLEMADADKDGSVTFEEFFGVMKQRMRQRGGDGKGPKGKGPKGKKGGRGRLSAGMLRRWDRDGDGKVGADEFPGRDDLFARLDADKDGFLTEADIRAARAERDRAARAERDKAARAGRDANPEAKPEAPTTTPKSGNVIEQQDTDGDGKLNRSEFQGPSSTWRLLDRNGDGWITPDELNPAPSK